MLDIRNKFKIDKVRIKKLGKLCLNPKILGLSIFKVKPKRLTLKFSKLCLGKEHE